MRGCNESWNCEGDLEDWGEWGARGNEDGGLALTSDWIVRNYYSKNYLKTRHKERFFTITFITGPSLCFKRLGRLGIVLTPAFVGYATTFTQNLKENLSSLKMLHHHENNERTKQSNKFGICSKMLIQKELKTLQPGIEGVVVVGGWIGSKAK